MDKSTRNAIERAAQQARDLLSEDIAAQLESTFDIHESGAIADAPGAHLTAADRAQREIVIAAIQRKRDNGMQPDAAVEDYLRDGAFTFLNRFVALKLLEARDLVQECVSDGEKSAGYGEFHGMAPGVEQLPDGAGYRLYLESLFDELSTEIKVLFDRRDPAASVWPRRPAILKLLDIVNADGLADIWDQDETIGWFYQFFNSSEERKKMRDESQAPRNSRELAVRNQFFTPRYVVQFLTDNTLGRTWIEMNGGESAITDQLEYLVRPIELPDDPRPIRDPRDLKILDPACGSGHFLLYAFDLLVAMYDEAWGSGNTPASELTGRTLRSDFGTLEELQVAAPALIVENNLYGVDIDARCAQIAALALWLRAQREYQALDVARPERPMVSRTHIVIAEPIPGDAALVEEFAARLDLPLLRDLFKRMVAEMKVAGDLGVLLQSERRLEHDLRKAREQYVKQEATLFPNLRPAVDQGELDLSGIDDDQFFHMAEAQLLEALERFASGASSSARRQLFTGDTAQGFALIEIARTKFDVVLMNPPFGAASLAAKKEFEKAYPRTKNDIYAAFVERSIDLLVSEGMLGAITSRTGFFVSSFRKWREEVILEQAPPVVFADIGYGVMDSAMVEAAAYCLRRMRS